MIICKPHNCQGVIKLTTGLALLLSLPGVWAIMMPAEELEEGIILAPEIADITVQRIKTAVVSSVWKQVEVTAQVIEMRKSASDMHAGQIICLVYEVPAGEIPSGYHGPRLPSEGGAYTAYLEPLPDTQCYKPLALRPQNP